MKLKKITQGHKRGGQFVRYYLEIDDKLFSIPGRYDESTFILVSKKSLNIIKEEEGYEFKGELRFK